MTQTETFAPAFPDCHGWLPWACWAALGGDTSMLATWQDRYRDLPLEAAQAAFRHGLMDVDTVSMLADFPDQSIRRFCITLPGVMGWTLTAARFPSGLIVYGVQNGALYKPTGSE